MLRPRHYLVLNRSITRSISYALRDSNRRKYKSNNTYTNNTVKMPQVSDTEGSGIVVILGLLIFIGLPFIVPGLWVFYLIGLICVLLKAIF
jgi:hypothetical protein